MAEAHVNNKKQNEDLEVGENNNNNTDNTTTNDDNNNNDNNNAKKETIQMLGTTPGRRRSMKLKKQRSRSRTHSNGLSVGRRRRARTNTNRSRSGSSGVPVIFGKEILVVFGIVVLTTMAFAAAVSTPPDAVIIPMLKWLDEDNVRGIFVFLLALTLAIPFFLPITKIVYISLGFFYGFFGGWVLAMLGNILGFCLTFFMGRFLCPCFHDYFNYRAESLLGRRRWIITQKLLLRDGIYCKYIYIFKVFDPCTRVYRYMIILTTLLLIFIIFYCCIGTFAMRFLPLPSNLLCYFLATTNIRSVHYVIGTIMKAPISAIPIYVAFGSNVRGEEKGKGVEEVMTKVGYNFWLNFFTSLGLLIIFGILFYFLRKRVEKDFNRRMSSFNNNFPNITNRRNKDANGEESDRTSSRSQQNSGEDDNGDGSPSFGGDKEDADDDENGKKYKREEEPLEVEILTV